MRTKALAGLTLIELILVIVIIATIVAIALPGITRTRMSANEHETASIMKSLVEVENQFYKQDPDNNSVEDYWSWDLLGLYAIQLPGGDRFGGLSETIAKADFIRNPAFPGYQDPTQPAPAGWPDSALIVAPGFPTPEALNGYWITAMSRIDTDGDGLAGPGFDSNNDGRDKWRFAFIAVPDKYGSDGEKIFIINRTGTVYAVDGEGLQARAGGITQYTRGGAWDLYPEPEPSASQAPTAAYWVQTK